jgi:hypothetical protein
MQRLLAEEKYKAFIETHEKFTDFYGRLIQALEQAVSRVEQKAQNPQDIFGELNARDRAESPPEYS